MVVYFCQEATLAEVKRAFRGLSIVLHPDKSSAPDADVQFRNLVSVYEVLKDSGKRETYDNVLKNGLPNWKSAMYYYRHYRKMGLVEMAVLLFSILTVGQYIVAWAVYVEKKYEAVRKRRRGRNLMESNCECVVEARRVYCAGHRSIDKFNVVTPHRNMSVDAARCLCVPLRVR